MAGPLLNLHGELLHVQIIRHVAVDRLPDDPGALLAKLLAPLGVKLFLRLGAPLL